MVQAAQALLDAIATGESGTLAGLLASGVDPATRDGGRPVVLDAAETGEVGLVRPFLDAGLPVDMESDRGTTALMCAVSAASLPLVEFLISEGRGCQPGRAGRG